MDGWMGDSSDGGGYDGDSDGYGEEKIMLAIAAIRAMLGQSTSY